MKRILFAITLAAVALGFSAPSHAQQDNVESEGCYETQVYQEYLYERPTYGDVIEKETRTRTWNIREWQWGDWSEWTDWPGAGPVNDDGRDRGPALHGSGTGWERQYRYVVVGQFQNGTEQYGWTEEAPPLEGWTLIDQREGEREVQVECPPETTQPPETTLPPETTVPETTQPPTTVPETTTPVTTTPETTVAVTDPPATTTPPPTGQRLPDTGNETWVMAILAGILLLGGTGLTLLTRRS